MEKIRREEGREEGDRKKEDRKGTRMERRNDYVLPSLTVGFLCDLQV